MSARKGKVFVETPHRILCHGIRQWETVEVELDGTRRETDDMRRDKHHILAVAVICLTLALTLAAGE